MTDSMSGFTYTVLGTIVAVGAEGQRLRLLRIKKCFSEIRRFNQIARIRCATRLVSATEITTVMKHT
jgi:hypothetical protein